jgi:hypothetical protein
VQNTKEEVIGVDEANKINEVKTNVGLTTVTSSGAGARPEVRTVAAAAFGVGGVSSAGAATAPAIDEQAGALFSPEEATDFRSRWEAIQASFVDEPRQAVEQADTLVAVAIKRLAEMFAAERNSRANGIAVIMSRPRIFVLHCAAIGLFSAASSRCNEARAAKH